MIGPGCRAAATDGAVSSLSFLDGQGQRIAVVDDRARLDHTLVVDRAEHVAVILARKDRNMSVLASLYPFLHVERVLVHVLRRQPLGHRLADDGRILEVEPVVRDVGYAGILAQSSDALLIG